MDLSDLLFGLRGRIGRVPYFVMICASVAFSLSIVGANPLDLFFPFNGPQLLAIVIASLVMLWVGIAMTVKRLHDLGLSGKNIFWIVPLTLFGDPTHVHSPLVFVATLVSFGVQIWLCIAPGTSATNRFGEAPLIGGHAR